MSVVTFTVVILTVYLLGLKLVSYYAYKASVESSEDYFLARRGVGIFALVATTCASIFSTGTVVSAPSEFFTKGTGYFWIFAFGALPIFMIPVVLKFWRLGKKYNFVTPADLLGHFFQSKTVVLLTAVAGLLSLIPYAAAQLVAVGKTFEALTDGSVPYAVGVTIACLAMGVYLFFGGCRAVVWTDLVQGVIFSILLLVTGYLAVSWAGGWSAVTTNLTGPAVEKATFTADLHYYEYFPLCATFFFLPYVWQRMYMAKSAKTLASTISIMPIVFAALFLTAWAIGTSALVIFPEGLADGDSVFGAIFSKHAPYFGAFVLVAAFAAGMSTVDSQLLSASSIITRDIRGLVYGRQVLGSDTEFTTARWSTIGLLAAIYFWSLSLQNQSILSLIILGISLTTIFAPVVYGLFFWKRSTAEGAIAGLGGGMLLFALHAFSPLKEYYPASLASHTWALIGATIGFFVVSLLTSPKKHDARREEYAQILNPAAAAEEGPVLPLRKAA